MLRTISQERVLVNQLVGVAMVNLTNLVVEMAQLPSDVLEPNLLVIEHAARMLATTLERVRADLANEAAYDRG